MSSEPGTVERTIGLLFELAAVQGEVTVSAIAARLALPQSTAHRLLQQFVAMGLVQKSTGGRSYQLGAQMHLLGELITRKDKLVQCALPAMHKMVKRFGERCSLGQFHPAGNTVEFVSYVESPHPLQYHVQMHQPVSVLWGSSGRVILAFLPAETIAEILKSNRRSPTGVSAMRMQELNRELGKIREQGFAVSRGEKIDGVAALSAPIFRSDARVVGGLTMTVPNVRFQQRKEKAMGRSLVAEARAVSTALDSLH